MIDLRKDDEADARGALINPRVVWHSDETEKSAEGCLSIPGMEEIVRRQPDLLILPVGEGPPLELERLRAMVGWRELQAVRDGNVVHIDASLFNRPGPNVTEAARRLAKILRPEAVSAPALP